jgi:hypothetical protein
MLLMWVIDIDFFNTKLAVIYEEKFCCAAFIAVILQILQHTGST